MTASLVESAIEAAHKGGLALLKFLSANDCGETGAHQSGIYLPKHAGRLFTPFSPERGRNDRLDVRIRWQGGQRETDSVITWYGQRKSEYRLTRFGHGFPYLSQDRVGDLLVLVRTEEKCFSAFVFESADDIANLQAALGVEAIAGWGVFDSRGTAEPEREYDCIDRQFRQFAEQLAAFPEGELFSQITLDALSRCGTEFDKQTADQRLVELVRAEYDLFKLVESRLCQAEVRGPFAKIDDFLKVAASIMNRRKSRAGRSMENHVSYLLKAARVPFEPRPRIEGTPDVVIPSKSAYDDGSYPAERLFMLGIKTTCKDRWRQVTREAPRVTTKHLLTLQEGITEPQLTEMRKQKVILVVPSGLHRHYPTAARPFLMDFEGFIKKVRAAHP